MTLVAFDDVHDNVEDPPGAIVVGDAVKLTVGTGEPIGAIGHVTPPMPGLLAGVHEPGGRGCTDVLLW